MPLRTPMLTNSFVTSTNCNMSVIPACTCTDAGHGVIQSILTHGRPLVVLYPTKTAEALVAVVA